MEEKGDCRHLRLCSCLFVTDKKQDPGQDEGISLSIEETRRPSMDTSLLPVTESNESSIYPDASHLGEE